MNKILLLASERRAEIESSKSFQRLGEKSQVLPPKLGREEVVKTRVTHSYDVMNSAAIIARTINIGLNPDYQGALGNTCLLHDIGHPAFGHSGAGVIDVRMKQAGLKEGFKDNNNNLVVIEKEQFNLLDYELASLIKYPDKLYSEQKELYIPILNRAIEEDIEFFGSKVKILSMPSRTLSCEIMDEADRNSYVCSDLTDFYRLGWGNSTAIKELYETNKYTSYFIKEFFSLAIQAIGQKDKNLISRAFLKLKIELNKNFKIGNNLNLVPVNEELFQLREDLYEIEKALFINCKEVVEQKIEYKKMLNSYIDLVLNEKFYPSKTYKSLIENSEGEVKLKFIRNMISEVSDTYVQKIMADYIK